MAALFISFDRMPFLASTLDNTNPLFAMMIAPGFYPDAPRRGVSGSVLKTLAVNKTKLVAVYKQIRAG